MLKKEELENPESCWNKAKDDERVFVLLGRDVASPEAIRAWARARVFSGKNDPMDNQISEAVCCAHFMEMERVGRG